MKSIALLLCLPLVSPAPVQEPDAPNPLDAVLRQRREDLAILEKNLHEVEAEYAATMDEMTEFQARNAAILGRLERNLVLASGGGGDEGMRERLARMTVQLDEVELEQAVLRATRKAIEQHTVHLSVKIAERLAGDELSSSMEATLDAQEESLDSQTGFEARLRLMEARLALAERQTALADRAGGRLLDSLRERLVEIDIEIEVHTVRREWLEKRIASASGALEEQLVKRATEQFERIQMENGVDEMTDRVHMLRGRRNDLRARSNDLRLLLLMERGGK